MGHCRLLYLDESGFAATPNVQRAWCRRGRPHAAEAVSHARRANAVAVLDYAANALQFETLGHSVKRPDVTAFLERLASQPAGRPTFVVLDNAAIHRGIDPDRLEHWRTDHHFILCHLPPYSPELNLIEILWKQAKFFWRRFVTWDKNRLLEEVTQLLSGYGKQFQIRLK